MKWRSGGCAEKVVDGKLRVVVAQRIVHQLICTVTGIRRPCKDINESKNVEVREVVTSIFGDMMVK